MRLAVAYASERVEGVRALAILVAGGQVSVHEARLGEGSVGSVARSAVEVSRDDDRRIDARLPGDLRDSPHDKLAAFPARQSAYVVEVRVYVEEREIRPKHPEKRPCGERATLVSQLLECFSGLGEPETP